MKINNIDSKGTAEDYKYLRRYAQLLDSKFRIPGTDITFGIDPIIGFIPVVGDIIGYGFSAVLIYSAFKKGVKGEILVKMLGNIALDAIIGMVPVIGFFFDFVYKANTRNYNLLNEFIEEDKHSGSAWPYVLAFLGFTVFLVVGIGWTVISLLKWIF